MHGALDRDASADACALGGVGGLEEVGEIDGDIDVDVDVPNDLESSGVGCQAGWIRATRRHGIGKVAPLFGHASAYDDAAPQLHLNFEGANVQQEALDFLTLLTHL